MRYTLNPKLCLSAQVCRTIYPRADVARRDDLDDAECLQRGYPDAAHPVRRSFLLLHAVANSLTSLVTIGTTRSMPGHSSLVTRLGIWDEVSSFGEATSSKPRHNFPGHANPANRAVNLDPFALLFRRWSSTSTSAQPRSTSPAR